MAGHLKEMHLQNTTMMFWGPGLVRGGWKEGAEAKEGKALLPH